MLIKNKIKHKNQMNMNVQSEKKTLAYGKELKRCTYSRNCETLKKTFFKFFL